MLQCIVDMIKRFFAEQRQKLGGQNGAHEKPARYIRQAIIGSGFGLLAGMIVTVILLLGVLRQIQSRSADLFYHPRDPSSQIALVVIDDQTVEDYGWPIDRIALGGFIYALSLGQPKVIALDFILPDPGTEEEDSRVAAAINYAGNIVQPVLGIESTRYPSSVSRFPAFDSVLRPAPLLRTPNSILAHAMIYPDPDGIVRRVPLAIDTIGQRYPAFGLAALALSEGLDPRAIVQGNQIILGSKPVPTDNQGQVLLNFVNTERLEWLSFSDVVRGRVEPAIFHNKIVLVGSSTLNAVRESYSLPLTTGNSRGYNVEIQASLIETLASASFLQEQDRLTQIGFIFAMAVIAGATLVHFSRFYAAALMLLYFAAYLLYGFHQFDSGIILMPLYPALALILTYLFTMTYRYFSRERTRARIARMFLGSVAPEAVNEVLAQYDRGALSLEGGRREVSVLSITLRGIAPLSEVSAPEAVIQVMNEYSARIFEIVFRRGGSIYSQVANTIIAMWNLPLSHSDHAQRAVQAALEIREHMLKLANSSPDRPHVESGLGVATGAVVAGRLASSPRAEYSVIGDVVNIAERLSILATQNRIYIDSPTRDQAGGEYEAQRGQSIHIRGKKDPVQSWELQPGLSLKQIPSQ